MSEGRPEKVNALIEGARRAHRRAVLGWSGAAFIVGLAVGHFL